KFLSAAHALTLLTAHNPTVEAPAQANPTSYRQSPRTTPKTQQAAKIMVIMGTAMQLRAIPNQISKPLIPQVPLQQFRPLRQPRLHRCPRALQKVRAKVISR